jgi:uncharacterized membrane protein
MRKALEAVGLASLAALIWITYWALHGPDRLPDRVPTHFDAAGNPNAWGSPSAMIFLPVIACSLYFLMSVVTRFPDAFHYPVRTTPQNIVRLQALTLDMIAWLKVELALLFTVLQWAFIQSAHTGDGHLFPMILPVTIVVIFSTLGWHLIATVRAASAGSDS